MLVAGIAVAISLVALYRASDKKRPQWERDHSFGTLMIALTMLGAVGIVLMLAAAFPALEHALGLH